MATTAQQPTEGLEGEYLSIPLDQTTESPSNPRKTWGDLTELRQSIRSLGGVLHPILVRHRGKGYEIICGHRRVRAAAAEGFETIPARVMDMDDREVLEAQVVENSQREDIHPLEEADGFAALHTKHGYTVEDLAAKVGKSVSFVYQRLKLCSLVPRARKAFFAGKIAPSTAVLLARIPNDEQQAEACAAVARDVSVWVDEDDLELDDKQRMPPAIAAQIIRDRYMLQLKGAPWKLTDADLVPDAGACSACLKRTGNQRELFDDIKSPDVCTDPTCFDLKRAAAWERQALIAREQGHEVLEGKAAEKALTHNSEYHALTRTCDHDPEYRSIGKVLGKAAKDHVVLARDQAGNVHELLKRRDATRLLKEAGVKKPPASTASNSQDAGQRLREKRAKLERRIRVESLQAIREQDFAVGRDDLELTLREFLRQCWHETRERVYGIWGIKGTHVAVDAYIKGLDEPALLRAMLDLALMADLPVHTYGEIAKPKRLTEVAHRHGVDIAGIRKSIQAEERAKERSKKKKPARKKVSKKKTTKAAVRKARPKK